MIHRFIIPALIGIALISLVACAQPLEPTEKIPDDDPVITIPSIDDSASISIVTWNIENFPQAGSRTTNRVKAIMDSLDADFYCLQEIQDKGSLDDIVDDLDQYSVIISDETSFMHLAIVYKHEFFLPVATENLFEQNDYNFASRPPLLVSFLYEQEGVEQVLNLIDVHMKCCNDGIERRHQASAMLHGYLTTMMAAGDSNFVIPGDWNDDIHDPDDSGQYAFEAFLDDPDNFYFVTTEIARDEHQASFPSWPSFIDNILISRSLFDEFAGSEVRTLRLDQVFSDYNSVVSDHRPVLWSFSPN